MPINNAFSRWLARTLEGRVQKIMDSRQPDFVIGDRSDPYLRRWWAIRRNSIFNIYIHEFMQSDIDRALHDHPFASLSIAIRGEMREVYLKRYRDPEFDLPFRRAWSHIETVRNVRPGEIIYRQAAFAHRMVVPEPGAVTIFITGPRIREWGFRCPNGWVPWRQFVDARDSGKVGRGCD